MTDHMRFGSYSLSIMIIKIWYFYEKAGGRKKKEGGDRKEIKTKGKRR